MILTGIKFQLAEWGGPGPAPASLPEADLTPAVDENTRKYSARFPMTEYPTQWRMTLTSAVATIATVNDDQRDAIMTDGHDFYAFVVAAGEQSSIDVLVGLDNPHDYIFNLITRNDLYAPTITLPKVMTAMLQAKRTEQTSAIVESMNNKPGREIMPRAVNEVVHVNAQMIETAYKSAMNRVQRFANGRKVPEAACNEAVMRMVGYISEMPPDQSRARVFELSGARAAVEPYVSKRAGAV